MENQHLVNCALPGLAKRHRLKKAEGWELLRLNLDKINEKLELLNSSDLYSGSQRTGLHMRVQNWYNANHNKLAPLGLNIFKNQKPSAGKLNYDQLAVIVLLDEIFARKSYIQKEIIRGHEKVEKPSIRQRLCRWWKNFKYNLLK